ncbi:MAG: hypothetical protein Kow0090_22410 [Myxococcota bacterium]
MVSGGDGDDDKETGGGEIRECETSKDCLLGEVCNGGVCEKPGFNDDDIPDASDDDDDNDVENPDPQAMLESKELDFGSVKVGEKKELQAVLTNTGGGALIVEFVTLGLGKAGFSLKEEPGENLEIPPGESLSVTVIFAPDDARAFSDTLKFVHNANGSPATVQLLGIGTGGASNLTITPSSEVTFDTTPAGSRSPPKKFTLKNDAKEGSLDVTISSIEIPKPGDENFEYSFSGNLPLTLPPGETLVIEVVFAPQSEGDKSASLVVKSDDMKNPLISVALKGKAIAAGATMTPSELLFPDTVYGQESSPQLVTITNTGAFPFNITAIAAFPESFVITEMPQPLPTTVAVGAKRQIWLKFVPQSEGEFEGTLTVETTIPGQEEIKVPLKGNGTALPVEIPIAKAVIASSKNTEGTYIIGISLPLELDASESYDPTTDGTIKGIASYKWDFASAPQNHDGKIEPITGDSRRVKFSTTTRGTYKISLVVINKGGKASVNDMTITIHALVQEGIRIEADWVSHNRNTGACAGSAGVSHTYVSICRADRRDVDIILTGPGNKICREPDPRDGGVEQFACDWGNLGSPYWYDGNGEWYRQPEIIEYVLDPKPISFSASLDITLEEDTYCPGFLTFCGDSSCTKEGVCVTVDVKINYVIEQSFVNMVLDKKGDRLNVCGLEYDYGKWTIVTP